MSMRWLLLLITTLGPRLPEAWPYIKTALENMRKVFSIAANGRLSVPRHLALSDHGTELKQRLKMHGVPAEEIDTALTTVHIAEQRVPS